LSSKPAIPRVYQIGLEFRVKTLDKSRAVFMVLKPLELPIFRFLEMKKVTWWWRYDHRTAFARSYYKPYSVLVLADIWQASHLALNSVLHLVKDPPLL